MTEPKVLPGYTMDRDERGLTKREREVLTGLVLGESQPQIARDLGLTKQRVNALVKALQRKGVVVLKGDKIEVTRHGRKQAGGQ